MVRDNSPRSRKRAQKVSAWAVASPANTTSATRPNKERGQARMLMSAPRSPSTASDPPRGSGLAWGGPARRPVKDGLALSHDSRIVAQRRHANLRQVRQADVACMLLESLVAPEERAGHRRRNDEHVKQ